MKLPRIIIAAPKSGSGKTALTCGLLKAIKNRGIKVDSFKIGPDYIDPMFHREVLGIESGNLDSYFTEADVIKKIFAKQSSKYELTVMEGVMGYYDGIAGISERASTYEVACITDSPVILVVDAKGASVSLAALVKGLVDYREDSHIRGVILNRVSEKYYERIASVIEKECKIPVLGYLPSMEEAEFGSRHLGLYAPNEIQDFQQKIETIAEQIHKTVDVEKIISFAKEASEIDICKDVVQEEKVDKAKKLLRIAVAKDEAFSFYYKENMDLLREKGVELIFFSPIHDEAVPEQIDGMILGGGYPENFAKELSANSSMKNSIKRAVENDMPVLAECGGFLYLQKELTAANGRRYAMADVLPGKGIPVKGLRRFGYLEATIQSGGVFGEAGQSIKGHEFHHWDCTENGDAFFAEKPMTDTKYSCMVHTQTMAAGFLHFYYYANPQMIDNFLDACKTYRYKELAKRNWEHIAKPLDSLGQLEKLVIKMCGIRQEERLPNRLKKALVTMCADHGVVSEGVTQCGSDVTQVVAANFANNCSSVNYMAQIAGADVYTIDIGMNCAHTKNKAIQLNTIIDRKIAKGTKDLLKKSAMSKEECQKAVQVGIDIVKELKEKGYDIIATGEMGIGNTTPTAVLTALLLNLDANKVTGRGAGLSDEGLVRKHEVIAESIQRVKKIAETDELPPFRMLSEAGGFEIAGMVGLFLGGVRYHVPIVIDGCISAVAALIAAKMDARVKQYAIASHVSAEPTGILLMEALELNPMIYGDMRLGEGSGAVALFPLIDMAANVYNNMASFDALKIDQYQRF